MGGLQIAHSMWVANITDQCILGLYFLESHGCGVDLGESVMHIGDQQIPLRKLINPHPMCYRQSSQPFRPAKTTQEGCDLATCTPVTSVVSATKGGSNGDLGAYKIKVPDSLQSLYERSVTNLSED